jgi:hypothetical protein
MKRHFASYYSRPAAAAAADKLQLIYFPEKETKEELSSSSFPTNRPHIHLYIQSPEVIYIEAGNI